MQTYSKGTEKSIPNGNTTSSAALVGELKVVCGENGGQGSVKVGEDYITFPLRVREKVESF